MKSKDLKSIVKEKYGKIASESEEKKQSSCCSNSSCCNTSTYSVLSDDYSKLEGYNPDADLGLGCGLPTEYANIKPGDHVLDLGSGAGNDCFIARSLVGDTGKVTGLDFTDEMLEKARINASKLNYTNVEFIQGDIENIPLPANSVNVIISNCVLNLVPDKQLAFNEMFRVTTPGGHFCVSDIVLSGELPDNLKQDALMYAGCVAGALQKESYLETIRQAGFTDIVIQKEKEVILTDEILLKYMSPEELYNYRNSDRGIYSITVSAKKN